MSPLIPMVIEQTSRGERSFDIYSRLLNERHHLPRNPDRRSDREPHRRAAPPPRVGGPRQGHLDLHQLAGRHRVCGARDLRHDAVHQARHADDLRRHGDVAWARSFSPAATKGSAARCRTRRSSSTRGRRGFSGQPTDIEIHAREVISTQAANGGDHVQAHRPDDREGRQGHGSRLLHDVRRGAGVRDHRPGDRAPL